MEPQWEAQDWADGVVIQATMRECERQNDWFEKTEGLSGVLNAMEADQSWQRESAKAMGPEGLAGLMGCLEIERPDEKEKALEGDLARLMDAMGFEGAT